MRNLSGLFLILIILSLAGCSGESSSGESKPTLGVSVMTSTNPFFMQLGETIRSEAAKHGYETLLVSGDYDVSKQKNQVADFIVQGVDAIVLCPVDSKAIAEVVKMANEAGIPVFTSDLAVVGDDIEVVSHVATDNYQAGRVAGMGMVEAVGESGKIGILDFPQAESVILRVRGFMDELEAQRAETGIHLEVVSQLQGGASKDISFKAMEDMIQAHPDLKGVFAINDPSALGGIAAMEKAGVADQIKVISVDGQPEGREAVRDGKIYGDAIQYPDKIASTTVDVIMKYMQGEEVPAEILIPTSLYRLEDALADTTIQ